MPMTNRLSSRSGTSPSTMTRQMIPPVVSLSIRIRGHRAVLSVVVASHPTRSSKLRVKREPARTNGTPRVRTPWVGQARRARSAQMCSRHRPRSRSRQLEATVRRSYRALVVNPHSGQASLLLRNRMVTTTWSGLKFTLVTDTPRGVDEALECCCGTHEARSSRFRFVSQLPNPERPPVRATRLHGSGRAGALLDHRRTRHHGAGVNVQRAQRSEQERR